VETVEQLREAPFQGGEGFLDLVGEQGQFGLQTRLVGTAVDGDRAA